MRATSARCFRWTLRSPRGVDCAGGACARYGVLAASTSQLRLHVRTPLARNRSARMTRQAPLGADELWAHGCFDRCVAAALGPLRRDRPPVDERRANEGGTDHPPCGD